MTKESIFSDNSQRASDAGAIHLISIQNHFIMKLTENLGAADKVVRVIVSAVIVILFVMDVIGGPLAAGLLALSAILVLTALVGVCPLYKIFGMTSRRKREL